jgi:hypothetical protein
VYIFRGVQIGHWDGVFRQGEIWKESCSKMIRVEYI